MYISFLLKKYYIRYRIQYNFFALENTVKVYKILHYNETPFFQHN